MEAARQRVEKLERSIFARAFRGKLISQDPTDEPAPLLVECIHAERE